jgi:hypothetical protein
LRFTISARRRGVSPDEFGRFLFRQLSNAVAFFFGLGQDAVFLSFDPAGFLDLFWQGDPELVNDVEDAILVYN